MNKIGFTLNKINTQQFAIIEDVYDDKIDEFNLSTNLGFGLDADNLSIISIVKVKFEQKNKPFLIIEVSCEFDISPETWESLDGHEIDDFPKGFLAHIAMLTIGTTRGVLHSKTDNTKFNDFLLPTINVTEMIENDKS